MTDLLSVRQEKHQQINSETYPVFSDKRSLISDVLWSINDSTPKTFDPSLLKEKVTICGRIIAFRKSGALTFIKLSGEDGSIQVVATRNATSDYDKLKLYDLGDIVWITGNPCYSSTNEKSVLILTYGLITKSRRPPPEKYAGISDNETKYRQRYLDLMSDEESRAKFMMGSIINRRIRSYLQEQMFNEFETSILNSINSGANAKPFSTKHNALDQDLYLRIAPELYLKRLLVGGFEKVFEIGKNFRNEGLSPRHNPEFTMLEFYQAYATFEDIKELTRKIILIACSPSPQDVPEWCHKYVTKWENERPYHMGHFVTVTMAEANKKALEKLGIENENQLDQANDRVKSIDLESFWKDYKVNEVYAMFEHLAEPFLGVDYTLNGKSVPVFVTQFPSAVSPLAKKNIDNPEICDRFELFVNGIELANSYSEENNPYEQAKAFKNQLKENNKDPMDYDEDYIVSLEHGMPPTIGCGIGISRLQMFFTNSSNIRDVILFPVMKPNR